MQSLEGLLWSLVMLIVAAGALARVVGWRELEGLAARAGSAVVLALVCLPLVRHEVGAVRQGIASGTSATPLPRVVVVGPEHLASGALVVAGHVAIGIWLLRRRARGEEGRRAAQQRDADRRRERGRLPPPDLDGGAL
ncbi:MAG: hypothetical protein EPO40_05695 [Myxococcaceae bacterium]|nr:MAG: hypothetical protein EPO40_05695 [Myxococcaceae bacterium]